MTSQYILLQKTVFSLVKSRLALGSPLQTKAILFKMISLSLALAIPPISSLDLLPANRLAQLMVPCTTVIETILNFPVLNFVRGSRKSEGLRGARVA